MADTTVDARRNQVTRSRILLGLGVGTLVGVLANVVLGAAHPLVAGANHYVAGPVGQIFLRLLLVIVMPLMFASVTLGVAGMDDLRRVGRVGARALAYFAVSTGVAATLGLVAVVLLRPGERIPPETRSQLMVTYASDASARVESAGLSTFGVDRVASIIPGNVFRAAIDLDVFAVLVFAVLFGVALSRLTGERAKPMTDLLQSVHDIALRIVGMAMWLAPVGVACLMFGVASRFGFDVVRLLGWFVAVVTAALLLHVFGVLLPAAWITTSLAPMVFHSRCRTALVTAFSTSSSGATLPTAIDVAERQLGIPAAIAGFVLPLGSVLCMNGTALFQAVTVITLAQALGVPLNAAQMVALVAVCSVTSVAATGVPGGAIPTLIAVLMMFGLPGEAIALVLGVDRLIDMLRTTVNVAGTLVITAIIARHDGIWNVAMVPQVERGRLAHA